MTTNVVEKVADKKDEKLEKRKALGRGLASLLPGPRVVTPSVARESSGGAVEETRVPRLARDDKADRDDKGDRASVPTSAAAAPATAESTVEQIELDAIERNPYQTRAVFDEELLKELAESVKANGVVQPIVLRPAEKEGRYVLVLGERRLRASRLAGKQTVPALVKRLSLQQAAEMTVLENIQRQDLNAMEQAEAFRVLSKEFQLTQAQIAERIGVSRETVANYMRLLRLPQDVMKYMLEGRLSFSDARELLSLEKEEHIRLVADEIVKKHLKWHEVEERVRELNGLGIPGGEEKKARGARWMDPNVRAAQTDMERTLGMRVRIKDRNGKGRIVIEYASVDDYERVVEMLK